MRVPKVIEFIACSALLLLAMGAARAQTAQNSSDLLVDEADSATTWTSANSLFLDPQIKAFGAASLKSVGTARDRFRRAFSTTFDVSRFRYLTFWYYVDRPDLLGTITGDHANDFGQIEITSSGTFDSQEWSWSIYGLHLQRGWNYIVLDLPGRDTSNDSTFIAPTRVNYLRIYHRPTASIVTRIDHVLLTNREPASFPLADFLQQKRAAASATALHPLDNILAFGRNFAVGSADRAKYCRQLTIDLSLHQISNIAARDFGVSSTNVIKEGGELGILKDHICGTAILSDADLLPHLQQLSQAGVAIIGDLATAMDFTMAAAADMREQMLDLDLHRIMNVCESTPAEVDAYIERGALPVFMRGANPLLKNCTRPLGGIASLLGTSISPPSGNRLSGYKQCMSIFEQQASECDNPYASPDDDYLNHLKIIPGITAQKIQEESAYKDTLIRFINDMPLDVARNDYGIETHSFGVFVTPAIEQLHQQYDVLSAELQRAKNLEDLVSSDVKTGLILIPPARPLPTPPPAPPNAGFQLDAQKVQTENAGKVDSDAARALLLRLKDEESKVGEAVAAVWVKICQATGNADGICGLIPGGGLGTTASTDNPQPDKSRCASMDVGGKDAWFENPVGASGKASQIDESDRIEHCLCELLDRNYSASLPGNVVAPIGNCPAPEERAAQKCLENPFDGRDGVRPECMHLMQPISTDRESLDGRICKYVNPTGCSAPYTKEDGSCGCGTAVTGGGTIVPHCALTIPNCDVVGGVPTADGCGCQPLLSGANECAAGGKDFYLTADPVKDLKVREFADKPLFSSTHLLVPRAGKVSFVTAGIKRAQLISTQSLPFRVALPLGSAYSCARGQTGAECGSIKVSCVRGTLFGSGATVSSPNTLIGTFPLTSLSATGATTLNLDFSNSALRTMCMGTSPLNITYFEFDVESVAAKPLGFYDVLDEFSSVKPACVQTPRPNSPTPGPRPLNIWPTAFPLSDGTMLVPKFNGVGPMPTPITLPTPPPIGGICVNSDGIPVPCGH